MSIVSYAIRVSESGQQTRSFKDDGDKALAAMPALFFRLFLSSPLPTQG